MLMSGRRCGVHRSLEGNVSVLARSVGNAFRNKVRSGAVVVILSVAIGLAMSMLVANQAVADRISALKGSVGNNLTVNPAGARGFQGGGEPLTADDVAKAQSVAHVASVTATLSLRLSNATSTSGTTTTAGTAGPGGSNGSTNLQSAVDPGTLGNRQNQSGTQGAQQAQPEGAPPAAATSARHVAKRNGDPLLHCSYQRHGSRDPRRRQRKLDQRHLG